MKKNNFIEGAFIATLGIVIIKIIGIIYVIPFYQIIGEKGGALYGYAYNIYNIFLNISSAGIPMAMSKIISEYNILGLYADKLRAFKIGKIFAIILSTICFILLFLSAPMIAYLIIGDISGGNSLNEITLVIRIVSTAIIVVPILSVYRGYLQGHKYIKPTTVSQIIEQLVRVFIILVGSYVILNILNLSLSIAVSIALLGATVGALFSYYYILRKYYSNKQELIDNRDAVRTFTDKEILKQMLLYAMPLILIESFRTIYISVDTVSLVKTLVNIFSYTVFDAESVMSIISTWGSKLNMIITSIATGIVVSLVPNLSENFAVNNDKEINHKINKMLQILLFLVVPMTVGLSFLAKPVWIVFYNYSDIGFCTFQYYVFTALFMSLFLTIITTIQLLKDYKYVIISLVVGFFIKVLFNISLMHLFNYLHLPIHYGSITATMLGYIIPLIICLIRLRKHFKIDFSSTIQRSVYIIIGTLFMVLSMLLLKVFVPIYLNIKFANLLVVLVYTIIGGSVYLVFMYKIKMIEKIFGKDFLMGFFKKK